MRRISKVGDLLKFLYNKEMEVIVEKLIKYDVNSTSIKEEKEIREHIDNLFQNVDVDQFGNEFNLERIEKIGDWKYTFKIFWTNHAKERSYLRADEIGFPPIVNEDIVSKLMEDIRNGKKIEIYKSRSIEESDKKISVDDFEYVKDIRNVVDIEKRTSIFIDVVTVINKKAKMDYRKLTEEESDKIKKKYKNKSMSLDDLKRMIETREI